MYAQFVRGPVFKGQVGGKMAFLSILGFALVSEVMLDILVRPHQPCSRPRATMNGHDSPCRSRDFRRVDRDRGAKVDVRRGW